MPATAKKLDVEHPMDVEAQLALLGERTATLQRDVTEIKSNVSRIDEKLDSTVEKLAALEPRLNGMAASFDAKLDGLKASFDAKLALLDTKMDGLVNSFDGKLSSLRSEQKKDLKAMQVGLIKWLFGALVGAVGTAGGIGYGLARFFG